MKPKASIEMLKKLLWDKNVYGWQGWMCWAESESLRTFLALFITK